ncbi:hypothetical protein RND81_14G049100 [Saponaria officinalis]|uniref:Rapid ALkalinization Factor n=1 Tax=Saponaria officinalis TaxID=3572 RepID=A0AAW1GIN1_SAPOF
MHTKPITQSLILLLLILQTHLNFSNGLSNLITNSHNNTNFDPNCDEKAKTCSTIEEIEGNNTKIIIRRILIGEKRYISYETLKRDVVPCSTAGSSYYSCGVSPHNHYSRGCSVITQCARFS